MGTSLSSRATLVPSSSSFWKASLSFTATALPLSLPEVLISQTTGTPTLISSKAP
jgi:hypothetical protein